MGNRRFLGEFIGRNDHPCRGRSCFKAPADDLKLSGQRAGCSHQTFRYIRCASREGRAAARCRTGGTTVFMWPRCPSLRCCVCNVCLHVGYGAAWCCTYCCCIYYFSAHNAQACTVRPLRGATGAKEEKETPNRLLAVAHVSACASGCVAAVRVSLRIHNPSVCIKKIIM